MGIGPAVTYHLNDQIDLHLMSGIFQLSPTFTSNGTSFASNINLGGTVVYGDYRPGASIFRLSLGLFRNSTSVAVNANPTTTAGGASTIQVNGTTYSTAALGGLNGTVSFNGVSPFVGFGLGRPGPYRPKAGVSLFAFSGVAFGSNSSTTLAPGNPAAYTIYPTLKADVAQAQSQLQNTLNILKLYPVAGFGLQVRI